MKGILEKESRKISEKICKTLQQHFLKCIFPMFLPQPKRYENFAKTFQTMKHEIFIKGFLITFRDIFLLGVEIYFYIFSFIKKSFADIFLKSFRNISENISLERVCKKNFGEASKNLAVTFLKVHFHDVHTVSKMLRQLCLIVSDNDTGNVFFFFTFPDL